MLGLAASFLVLAIIAGLAGFTGAAGDLASIAWLVFIVFVVLFIVSAVANMFRGRSPHPRLEVDTGARNSGSGWVP